MASHALPTPPCTTCSPPRAFASITARRCISHVGQTPLCASNEIAIRSRTYALSVCARAHVYASVARIMYVCAKHREASISTACIRIIYSTRVSLTAPTVTGRSSGRFSARMTVYGPLFCANFSFSLFFFHFPFSSASVFLTHTTENRNYARILLLANISIRDIVFQTPHKMKQDRRSRHVKRIHFGL